MQSVFATDGPAPIIIWNGIPTVCDYKYDLSEAFRVIPAALLTLATSNKGERLEVYLTSQSYFAKWWWTWNGNQMLVDSHWEIVPLIQVDSLNERRSFTIDKRRFLLEWLPIASIVLDSLQRAGYQASTTKGLDTLERIVVLLRALKTDTESAGARPERA